MLRYLLLAVLVVAALAGESQYELSGRFTPEGRASVSLFGVASPFLATTLSEDGRFSFKKLEPGAYTVAVYAPGSSFLKLKRPSSLKVVAKNGLATPNSETDARPSGVNLPESSYWDSPASAATTRTASNR